MVVEAFTKELHLGRREWGGGVWVLSPSFCNPLSKVCATPFQKFVQPPPPSIQEVTIAINTQNTQDILSLENQALDV
jgi:hypothetical protein